MRSVLAGTCQRVANDDIRELATVDIVVGRSAKNVRSDSRGIPS